jgi:hypothetical protein
MSPGERPCTYARWRGPWADTIRAGPVGRMYMYSAFVSSSVLSAGTVQAAVAPHCSGSASTTRTTEPWGCVQTVRRVAAVAVPHCDPRWIGGGVFQLFTTAWIAVTHGGSSRVTRSCIVLHGSSMHYHDPEKKETLWKPWHAMCAPDQHRLETKKKCVQKGSACRVSIDGSMCRRHARSQGPGQARSDG